MTEPVPSEPGLTPSQTVGPFLHIVLPWDDGPDVAGPDEPDVLEIVGQVRDGAGAPVTDALVETWQVEPEQPGRRGFGRCPTNDEGRFRIRTRRPVPLPAEDGRLEAPHLDVSVFARGLLDRLVTRIYLDDEGSAVANADDPVLAAVPADRRATLLARPQDDGRYRFDIVLQGAGETVFFDL